METIDKKTSLLMRTTVGIRNIQVFWWNITSNQALLLWIETDVLWALTLDNPSQPHLLWIVSNIWVQFIDGTLKVAIRTPDNFGCSHTILQWCEDTSQASVVQLSTYLLECQSLLVSSTC
jgi:hypothetical protein